MPEIEITIIGGGIVGCAIADAVATEGRSVVLLEQEDRLAAGTTSRNSEVAHGGMYYPTGSLKARCCVRGRRLLKEFCTAAGVGYREVGKLIVATSEAQLPQLQELLDLGLANDVENLRLIAADELQRLEPEISGCAALYSPATAILDAEGATRAYAARAAESGARIMVSARVIGLEKTDGCWQVRVERTQGESWTHSSAVVINAAGLHADTVASLAGFDPDPSKLRLEWVKGNYFSVSPVHQGRVNHLIYPVPDPGVDTLGIHVCLDLGGQMRLGPDYQPIARVEDYSVDPALQSVFHRDVGVLLPFLGFDDLQPAMCGIRPKLAPHRAFSDFRILRHDGRYAGLINLVGIDSPGLTSAPSLARIVAELVADRSSDGTDA